MGKHVINKEYLAGVLASEMGLKKKDALRYIDLIFKEMGQGLAEGNVVDITAFGKFVIFNRKARMGINPVTKERMEIPATRLPKFRPSQTLKNKCNNERAALEPLNEDDEFE